MESDDCKMEVDPHDPRLKQLKIKSGVLKRWVKLSIIIYLTQLFTIYSYRLDKELAYYRKEIETENKRLESMKKDNCSSLDAAHQELIIKETVNLLPDCQKRLEDAYQDLKNLIHESEELVETEAYNLAKEIFESVKL